MVYYKEEAELTAKIGEFDMDSLLKDLTLDLEEAQKELNEFNTYKEELQAICRAKWLEKIKSLSIEEVADILNELELKNNALNYALAEEGGGYDIEEYLIDQFEHDKYYDDEYEDEEY